MANSYDIHIKMDYFLSGDDYEMMLDNKKRWKEEVERHNDFFESISTKGKYQEKWNEVYGESEGESEDAEYFIKNSSIGDMSLDDIEREAIERTLKFFNDNRRASAKSLGMSERRLYRKICQYEQDTKNVKSKENSK